jgi:gamma-glutamylputrescine oxidase
VIDTDVCVVGGGLAGCSSALHLAERGYRVTLLEAQTIGAGASGRSGGQTLAGIACGQAALEKLAGPDDARRIWQLSVEALRLQQARITGHGIDCDYRPGHMQVAIKPRHERELRAELDLLQGRYDYGSLRWMAAEELRATLATDRYRCALLDTAAGHLDPLKYVRGMARAATDAGVTILEGVRAESHQRRRERIEVHTASGERISARSLVLCGNSSLGQFAPTLARKIMGVTTYIIATAPLGRERAEALISNDAAVADTQWVLDYFRRSADHRLLFGGRVSYSGLDTLGTQRVTRARMLRVFPQLADVPIERAWGGTVDITRNRAPHFGQLEPDVYFLQGFSGHGMALTGLAGALVAEAIAEQQERFDVFARLKHRDFPGGRGLRRPILMLAMLAYRLRDIL